MSLPFYLAPNQKFAAFATTVVCPPKEPMKLSSGVRLYNRFPVEVFNDFWRTELLCPRDLEALEQSVNFLPQDDHLLWPGVQQAQS